MNHFRAKYLKMIPFNKLFVQILFLWVLALPGCEKETPSPSYELTIIFINDQHGQIDNFGKLKHLIDREEHEGEVIVACSGDMFSGNPVVDIYDPQGYPMIDLMNRVGFDIAVIGNHEFDYGKDVLADRINQADFEWVCANVDIQETGIPQPNPYSILEIADLRIVFLGLIETNGMVGEDIPSTHPSKVEGIHFERPEKVVGQYATIKEQENADLFIALTHLGHNYTNSNLGDFQLAEQFPYFDLIIGGHSNPVLDTIINGIPVFQAGNYLNYAGKINIRVKDKQVEEISFEAIDLNAYPYTDPGIENQIKEYHNTMENQLNEVVGYSELHHERFQVGCFYTDALRARLNTDISFQNYGGIRHNLDEGNITVQEIYEIDPFNNRAMIYTMTCQEVKTFMTGTQAWHCYSGFEISTSENGITLLYPDGSIIPNDQTLTVGINDYIPAVDDQFFPETGKIQPYTTAEALIFFLKHTNPIVNYPDCERYFNYQ